MSFILDALKKSEIERQRQSQPGLMDTPTARGRGGLPLWAILLGALLAINVVVLAVMLPPGRLPSTRHLRWRITSVPWDRLRYTRPKFR